MAVAIQGAVEELAGRARALRRLRHLPRWVCYPPRRWGERRPCKRLRTHGPRFASAPAKRSTPCCSTRRGGHRDDLISSTTRAGLMDPAGPVDTLLVVIQCRLRRSRPTGLAARSAGNRGCCRFSDRKGQGVPASPCRAPEARGACLWMPWWAKAFAGLPAFGHRSLRLAAAPAARGGAAVFVARTGYTGEERLRNCCWERSAGQGPLATTA